MKMSIWARRGANLAIVLSASIVAIGGAEILLRHVSPQLTYSRVLPLAGTFYAPSPLNTFTLQRNYRGTQPSMETPGTSVAVRTNASGFRGEELVPGRTPVLVIGDSYTFGVFVNDAETYPARLDRLIGESHKGYQVINAGYAAGWETDQHYVWLKAQGLALRPEIVILGVFLGNDILNIAPEAWAEKDAHGLPVRYLNRNLVVDDAGYIRAPGPADIVEALHRMPILRDSHVAVLLARGLRKLQVGQSSTREALSSSEMKLAHIFGEYSAEFHRKERNFMALVSRMKTEVEINGGKFLVALLPMNFMIEPDKIDFSMPGTKFRHRKPVYYRRLGALLEREGIQFIDIESIMLATRGGPYFPANGEVHFNPRGHELTAQAIFDYINRHNLLAASSAAVR